MKCENCRFTVPCWAGQFGLPGGEHLLAQPIRGAIHVTICPECGRLTISFLDQKDPDDRRKLARIPGGGEFYSRSNTELYRKLRAYRGTSVRENELASRIEEVCLPQEFHFLLYCEQRPLTNEMLDLWRRSDKHYETRYGSVAWCQYSDPTLNMRGPLLIRECYRCGHEPERPFVEIVELDRRRETQVSTG